MSEPMNGPVSVHAGSKVGRVSQTANGVLEYSLKSSKLDEFEHAANSMLLTARLTPPSGHKSSDSRLFFHGSKELGLLKIQYGIALTADLLPEQNDDRVAFGLALNGHNSIRWRGEEVTISRGNGAVTTNGSPKLIRYDQECDSLVLLMSRPRIGEYCAKLLGRDLASPVSFATQFPLDTPGGQNWLRLVRYAEAEFSRPDSLVRTLPAVRRQLEQTLMTAFLLSHSHNFSELLLKPQPAAAPYYVKRAEEYIEQHFADSISLADIAAYAGVSARSLQNGFQNFRGMTPMAFLRTTRLRHAHRELAAADPKTAKVIDIAMRAGFGHMGEFASLHKHAFGMTPNETLLKKIISRAAGG